MKVRCLLTLVTLILFAVYSLAQTETGTIAGTVTDPSGAVVPGAKVTVTEINKQFVRTATTGGRGDYAITNLEPGTYDVTVDQSGFAQFKRRVDVTVGSRNMVDASLGVSGEGTTVEVTAAQGAQVETQSQSVSQVVTGTEITQLPTITRNPYDLVQTAGNVSTSEAQTLRGTGFTLNGQRSASTNILLDGGENRDEFTTNVGANVPLDSVQEFRVITSDFSAEYGRASGGIVNVATRSGTNNWHGSVYEFNRNSFLAANNYQNNATAQPRDHFNRNQFGYSIGGPIVKDKAFFFQSTEWTRVRSLLNTQALVPDPTFLALTAPNTQSFFTTLGKLRPDVRFGPVLTAASLVSSGNLSAPIPGIPGTTPVFDTINFPSRQDAGGGDPQNTYFGVARLDFNVTPSTSMFVRYGADHEIFSPGFVSTSPYQGFETGQNTLNQNVVLNLTHVFSPTLVSQSKVDYNRFNLFQPLGPAGIVPGLFPQAGTPFSLQGENIILPGYLPLLPGSAIPFGGPQNLYQFYQDFSLTHGAHQLRIGGQFIQIRDNRTFGAFETGFETLARQGHLDQMLGNMLTGDLRQVQTAVNPQGKFPCFTGPATALPVVTPACSVTLPVTAPSFARNNYFNDAAIYLQDSWKATNRLTLNLGVRWEYYGVQHNRNQNLDSNFYLGSGANGIDRIANGFVATVPTSPLHRLWEPSWRNFAPRVGFAWDLFGTGRTALRGGYGIGYERNFGNVTFNVIQNPPAYAVISLVSPADTAGAPLPITTNNFGPLGGATGAAPILHTSLRAVDPNIKTAYAHFWSLSLEHEIVRNTVLGLEYSGSRGIHQYSISNLNPSGSGVAYLGLNPAVVDPFTRINQQFSNINFRGSDGDSYYNGLNVRLQSNNFRSAGLALTANYTYSHAMDDLSSTFSESSNNFNLGFTDPFFPGLDRGNADYDMRHRVTISAIWEPPVYRNSKGLLSQTLGGWGFAPIISANTGTPFTVFDCFEAFTDCPRYAPLAGNGLALTGSGNPPLIQGEPNTFNYLTLPPRLDYLSPLLGISDFGLCTAPGQAAPNDCPFPSDMTRRNAFRGPGHWMWDMGIYKSFKITERVNLQFRGELFNILNHPNLFVVGSSADPSSSFVDVGGPGCPAVAGAVPGVNTCPQVQAKKGGLPGILLPATNTREHRNVQLGLKLTF